MNDKIYQEIWNYLNQSHSKPIDQAFESSLEINFSKVDEFFKNRTDCKVISLDSLNNKSQNYLIEQGLSLEYIFANFKKAIDEVKYADKINLDPRQFQLEAIKDKFVSAICPFTGVIIKSNRSIPIGFCIILYRFTSQDKVFYLATTNIGQGFTKNAFYFPDRELIVNAIDNELSLMKEDIIRFKISMVKRYQAFDRYFFKSDANSKVAVITGHYANFAHHLWNELSGIHKLYRKNLLNKIDSFLVLNYPLGEIQQIFPEIPDNRIKKIASYSDLIEEIINNNYMAINVGDIFIKDDLTNRVYQVALQNCPPETIERINKIKDTYSPLLWISLKSGFRTWINEVDGFSKIICSLAQQFPQMGVVFVGFSPTADKSPDPKELENMKYEQEKANKIIENLSHLNIGLFNTVGCSIFESNIWSHAIDFYISHYGTINTKVGWLANKPGTVHTNTTVLKYSPSYLYVRNVREFAIQPIYISSMYVKDIPLEKSKNERDPRNDLEDYDVDWKIIYAEALKLAGITTRGRNLITNWRLNNSRLIIDIKSSMNLKSLKQIIKKTIQNLIRYFDSSKI